MVARVTTDYAFDAFVSYSHSRLIKPWVLGYVVPHLQDWLQQQRGGEPARVFVDKEEITPGQRWPQRVRDALLASKCLVPVLSGDYFFKPWCKSEWQNFVDREDLLHLDITSGSLIVPIIHNDGEHFPPRAREYQPLDFADCCTTSGNFENHVSYPKFEGRIKVLAAAVATVVGRAPVFDPIGQSWRVTQSCARCRC